MASITQDMRFCLSLIEYAKKFGVSRADIKLDCIHVAMVRIFYRKTDIRIFIYGGLYGQCL